MDGKNEKNHLKKKHRTQVRYKKKQKRLRLFRHGLLQTAFRQIRLNSIPGSHQQEITQITGRAINQEKAEKEMQDNGRVKSVEIEPPAKEHANALQ